MRHELEFHCGSHADSLRYDHGVVITLVHGTWAPDAPWTQSTSDLAQALSTALERVHFERFVWSGSNSHRARCRAARNLQEHISNCAGKYGQQDHFVIAHSHGGNVALYALRDKDAARSVRGTICLSTPFIHCRKRDLGPAGLVPLGVFGWALAVALSFRPIKASLPALDEWDAFELATVVTLIGAAALYACIRFVATRRFSVADMPTAMARILDSFQFPAMICDAILVVRAAGDEASAALEAVHFISLLLAGLARVPRILAALGSWVDTLDKRWSPLHRILLGVVILLTAMVWFMLEPRAGMSEAIVNRVLFAIGTALVIPSIFGTISILITAVAGTLLVIILTLIAIVSSPFGLDAALLTPVFEVSAETTPPGKVTLLEISTPLTQGLWHSTPYGSEEAFREIVSWIRNRRETKG